MSNTLLDFVPAKNVCRETKRERERQRDRQTDRQAEAEIETDRQTDRGFNQCRPKAPFSGKKRLTRAREQLNVVINLRKLLHPLLYLHTHIHLPNDYFHYSI